MKRSFFLLASMFFVLSLFAQSKSEKEKSEQFINRAVDAFGKGDFEKACLNFESSLKITNPFYVDSIIFFNAGVAADRAKLFDKAIYYYNTCLKIGYESFNSLSFIINVEKQRGNTDEYLRVLKHGIDLYPDQLILLFELINYHLGNKQNDEALKLIDLAILRDPKNHTLYFAKGSIYDMKREFDLAKVLYEKAVELKPDYFDAYFNLGVLFFNSGAEMIKEANEIPANENHRYEIAFDLSLNELEKALPYLEKAYETNPNDQTTIQSLKQIYFKLRSRKEAYLNCYTEISNKIDGKANNYIPYNSANYKIKNANLLAQKNENLINQQSKFNHSNSDIYKSETVNNSKIIAEKDQNKNTEQINKTNDLKQNIENNVNLHETKKPADTQTQSKVNTQSDLNNNITIEQNIEYDFVDINIPRTNKLNENTFAVVIGNENYENEQAVPFAINDAQVFSKYLIQTLGIPQENIHTITNATLGQIYTQIKWLQDIQLAYEGEASIIFYYAGHGLPNESTRDSYILPIDGISEMTMTAIKLDLLYSEIARNASKQVIVILDACFSGAARGGMLAKGRMVKVVPKNGNLTNNLVVLSATKDDQTAYPYTDKKHGLFTYYLLRKLNESKGDVSLEELSDYIISNVSKKAIVVNSKPQTPTVIMSPALFNSWQQIRLGY